MCWGVYPRLSSSLCTPWPVGGFEFRVDFMCKMLPIWNKCRKNSAKSVILPHKHRINNVPGRKSFFFPAHCGSFSMSSLQTHERRHWWASNVTQTHLEKCEERRKIKTKITAQERKINAAFLQVTMHLSCLSDGLVGEWISIDLLLVPKLIYCFLGLVQLQSSYIHEEWMLYNNGTHC